VKYNSTLQQYIEVSGQLHALGTLPLGKIAPSTRCMEGWLVSKPSLDMVACGNVWILLIQPFINLYFLIHSTEMHM